MKHSKAWCVCNWQEVILSNYIALLLLSCCCCRCKLNLWWWGLEPPRILGDEAGLWQNIRMPSIVTLIALVDDEKRNEQLYRTGVRRSPSMKLDNVHDARPASQWSVGRAQINRQTTLTTAVTRHASCSSRSWHIICFTDDHSYVLITVQQPAATTQPISHLSNGACHLIDYHWKRFVCLLFLHRIINTSCMTTASAKFSTSF